MQIEHVILIVCEIQIENLYYVFRNVFTLDFFVLKKSIFAGICQDICWKRDLIAHIIYNESCQYDFFMACAAATFWCFFNEADRNIWKSASSFDYTVIFTENENLIILGYNTPNEVVAVRLSVNLKTFLMYIFDCFLLCYHH